MNTLVTWEELQGRLFHLGWLGEELPAFVTRDSGREDATPTGAWLFRQIVREARLVAAIAAEYVAECERAGLSGPHGTTPAPPAWRTANETRPGVPTRPCPPPGTRHDRAGEGRPGGARGGGLRRHDPEGGDAL
jgi:hypothetical protein